MATKDNRVQVNLESRDAERLDKLAETLKLSKSATAGLLITAGLKTVFSENGLNLSLTD